MTVPTKVVLLLWIIFVICVFLCHTILADLMCVMFPFDFVTFPYGTPGQVWYLIVLIPDLCFFSLTCNLWGGISL